jgi:hypothetical protein
VKALHFFDGRFAFWLWIFTPVAGNQQLTRASARIVELVLRGDSRWLEVP